MKELIAYLNRMSRPEQMDFAGRCQTSVSYLRKAASAGQLLGDKLCVLIERESGYAVTRKMLHPDDWEEIWPELANTEGKERTHA